MSRSERNGAVTYAKTGRRLAAMLEVKTEKERRKYVKVSAGSCPKCQGRGEIYDTKRKWRYCKCNHCGHTWQFEGPLADAVHDAAYQLVESLKTFEVVMIEGQEMVLWDAKSASETMNALVGLLP